MKKQIRRTGKLSPVEQHWSLADISRAYGVSYNTVRAWVQQGRFGKVKYLPQDSSTGESGPIRIPDSAIQLFDHRCAGGSDAVATFQK